MARAGLIDRGLNALGRWVRQVVQLPQMQPEEGFFSGGSRDDQYVDRGAHRLTPQRLGEIFREAESGDIRRQMEAFEQIETDPHLFGVLSARKGAAVSKPLQLSAASDDGRAQAAVELCQQALDGLEDFEDNLRDLADAIGKGFAVEQIVWKRQGGMFLPVELEWWPQREFKIRMPQRDAPDPVEGNSERLRVLTSSAPSDGEPLAPYQWMVHRYKALSATLPRAALLRVVAWPYVFKHYSIRDWAIFAEAYGMPLRVGKYPRGADDKERRAIRRAVFSIGKDAAAIIPADAEIEFVAAKYAAGKVPHEVFARYLDEQMSKAIVGQTLTTEATDRGARALGEVHENVKLEITRADCRALARTVRRKLLRPIVGFNLGWDVPVPTCEFVVEEQHDLLKLAQAHDYVFRKWRVPVDREFVYRTYKVQRPAENSEDLLELPQATQEAA